MGRFSSLRLRLLAYAAAVIMIALVVTGIGLAALFERYAERRVGQELDVYLAQLSGSLRFDANGVPTLARHPSDPRFNQVFSGLYWQVAEKERGVLLRSRSLWDSELSLPIDSLVPGQTHRHIFMGPAGVDVLAHEQSIIVPTSSGDFQLQVSAAIDIGELEVLTAGFTQDLVPALTLLGFVLLVGFWIQISAGLKPMQALSEGVAAIRDGQQERLGGPVPREVAPLVEEVNALLDNQEKDMIRARDRAADLAHGLKTPLTALATDVSRLRQKGQTELADDIEDLANRMRRHLDRELVLARQRHGRHAISVALTPAVRALVHTLERTPLAAEITYSLRVSEGLAVGIDPDDLNDILGNLLENATRHARSKVGIGATQKDGRIIVEISDDGAGLSKDQLALVLGRGQRLDTAPTGAGLGLAIVSDIVGANDGALRFEKSELGGLLVVCELPAGPNPAVKAKT